jgi:CP family cyanate transporter-like MFS transporter
MTGREQHPGLARTLAALALAGLVFRVQVLILGPLLPEIRDDLGVSNAAAGLLGSIPVLGMGVLAPLGPVIGRWLGARMAVALCILAVAVSGALRALVPGWPAALLATAGIGLGMGMVGPVFSMVVRAHASTHPTAGTGAYVTGMIVGGSTAALAVVPLSAAFGGWRGAALAVSLAGLVALAAWWVLAPHDHGEVRPTRPQLPRLPWREGTGWKLGLMFGLQSVMFYGSVSWLATVLRERGVPVGDATEALTLFTTLGLVTTLTVPVVGRFGTRRAQLATAATAAAVGAAGLALGPADGLGDPLVLGSILVLGLGIGYYFPLMLTLPIDVADSPAEAASLAALMFLVGYAIAAAAPAVLGAVRDATGSFEAVIRVLAVVAALMIPATFLMDPRHGPRRE